MWKLYDIVYKENNTGPGEIIIDLDGFEWSKDIPIGFGNLNSKTYKAIKEVTGYFFRYSLLQLALVLVVTLRRRKPETVLHPHP